jgi:hypothetical protein
MRLWCDGFRGGAYIAFVVMGAEWSRSGTKDPGPETVTENLLV